MHLLQEASRILWGGGRERGPTASLHLLPHVFSVVHSCMVSSLMHMFVFTMFFVVAFCLFSTHMSDPATTGFSRNGVPCAGRTFDEEAVLYAARSFF